MVIPIIQIIISVIIVTFILLQERSAGLSGIFGGEGGGGFYQTRRGIEKFVFGGTIVLTVLFVLLSVIQLINR